LVAPTIGALLGLVALSGLAEPLARGRRWYIGLPLAVGVALLGTFALSGLVNSLAARSIDSSSIAAGTEPDVIISAAMLLLLSALLLRPTPRGRALGVVLAIGGGMWITQAILVAAGLPLEGWLVVSYQVGLYLMAVGGTWLLADALRSGRYRVVVLSGLAIVCAVAVAGSLPVLSGGLWLVTVGGLAAAAGLRRLSRDVPVRPVLSA
jgi:hypothetical protein